MDLQDSVRVRPATNLHAFSMYLRYISEALPRTLMHCTLNSVTVQFHTAPARAPPLFVCLSLALVLLLFICLFTLASVN